MTVPDRPCDAILFDLLTGLLDSWTLWNDVAGDAETGQRWRQAYLRLTYGVGAYRPYEELVAEAARESGLGEQLAPTLAARWDELQPWPEVPTVLRELAGTMPIGVVTNCSIELGRRAADRPGVPFDVVVTAEEAGFYKPRPEPYRAALDALGLPAERVLFVAGSKYDVAGASTVGMPVWWHNRIGLDLGDSVPPIAEERSLLPLPAFIRD